MRIIAGDLKGRQLKAVPGRTTRPTADKVKEAVFQMIGPFFDGGLVLDLFAGSGSLGIEALSRGMDYGIFVDKHPQAIHTIKENIRQMHLDEKTEIFRADAFRALKACSKRELQFDLIMLDPPYKKVDYEKLLKELTKHRLVKPDGIIYCEHDPSEKLPKHHDVFAMVKQETYGATIGITIYRASL